MGKSIIIGNREYDAVTGLPLSSNDGEGHVGHISRRTLRATKRLEKQPEIRQSHSVEHAVHPASQIHSKTQRSKTLNRAYIKNKPVTMSQPATVKQVSDIMAQKPVAKIPAKPAETIVSRHNTKMVDGIRAPKRSLARVQQSHVAKTAPVSVAKNTVDNVDAPPVEHPIAKKASHKQILRKHEAERQQKAANSVTPSSVITQAVVNEALENAPKHHAKQLKTGFKYRSKIISAVCGCLALMLLGGYLTYLNAPNLSVRIAAVQAGIDASYPSYHPDGYSLHGPVAYNNGEVSMTFVANANKEVSYYLEQSRSNWDSAALLENYVQGQSGGEYSTSQINGMTIYTYGGNAAWVSGGILYTINGNAQLSPDQIRKIATSLS